MLQKIRDFVNIKKRLQKKNNDKKLKNTEEKRKALLILFRQLYVLVKDVDKRLPNRASRKQFWSEFIKKGNVRVNLINQLMQNVDRSGKYLGDKNNEETQEKCVKCGNNPTEKVNV